MIPLLPKWNLHNSRPSFYDADSVTMLELAAKLHGTMNSLIEDYNKLTENVNKLIGDFKEGTIQDLTIFQTALRQEFQDFIDAVNLEQQGREQRIDQKVAEAEATFTRQINELEAATNELIAEIRGSIEDLMNTEY